MQYPPQPAPDRQSHIPSEIYMPEQPQGYLAQQVYAPQYQLPGQGLEMTRPPVQAEEIVVYPNHTQAILRTSISAVALVLLIAIIPTFLILISSIGPSQFSDLVALAFVLAIALPAIALIGWLTWRMASQLIFSSKPLMTINREGITVGRMPMLSGFSIAWAEIGAIHSSRYIFYKYLCISPRYPDQFLARFNGWERFNRRLNSMIGSPLYVPQIYLGKPVEEIFQQLYDMYANELRYYQVQLRA